MSSTLSEQLGALASSSSSSSSSSSRAAAVTLLYANVHGSIAKSIPLSTMRENAIVAYESLVASLPTSSSSSSAHCTTAAEELLSARNLTNFERGTATHESNIRMDVELDAFLSWLALHLAAAGAGNARNGGAMVIIEYLLRLYELHARPHAACALLTALLPPLAATAAASTSRVSVHSSSSSSSSSFFIRAATIIEVAGIGLDNVAPCGCWSFLRPYITNNGARGGGGGGGGMTMMNRRILAIQCAKNDAFARQIIIDKLSIMASEYIQQQQERQYYYSNNSNTTTVDGASAILSFTASILVESLYIQMKSPNNGGSEGRGGGGGGGGGGVCESTVRALLPTVLDACRHHSRQVVEAVVVDEEGEEGEGKFSSNSNGSNNNGNGNNNEDQWKGWGYILLSTIVTTCPSLGHTVKVAMCDAIVDGLVAVKTRGGSSSSSSKTKTTKSIAFHEASLAAIDNDDEKNDNDDACCGAILTLITVLGTMNTTTTTTTTTPTTTSDDYNDEEFRYYLPLLPHKMRKKSTIIDYLGCELPISTYKRLSKLQYGHVASAISMAMNVVTAEEDDDDAKVVMITMDKIAPLVASLIMHALHKLDIESKKMLTTTSTKAKSKNDVVDDDDYNIKCKADRDVLLILGLFRRPSLLSLWKANRASLVAATTVHAISSYDRLLLHNNDDQLIVSSSRGSTTSSSSSSSSTTTTATIMTAIVERYKSIIDALSIVDRDAHERGVAYVINAVTIEAADTSNEYRMSNLVRLLGGHDVSTATSTITTATKKKKGGNIDEAANPNLLSIGNSLLPSRVALESADVSVRIDAIARLKLEVEENSRIWDKDLGRALLRRLVADDDASVASAAGMIVASRLKRVVVEGVVDEGDDLVGDLVSLTKEALTSLLRWTYIGKDDNSSWSPIPPSTVPTESRGTKKGKAKKSSTITNKDDVPCPLLACISICGSAARLILEQESLDMDRVVADLFHEVVLSLGAHIISGSYTESNVIDSSCVIRDTASNAATTELLHVFNNDDGGIILTVPELITKQRKCLTIMNHLFGSPQYNMSPISSPLLQSRFLWFALHSYSGVLSAPPPKRDHAPAFLQVTLNLILKQMQSYTKESKKSAAFQWEVHFLVDLCKRYLVAISDVYEIEQCILGLTSISSDVSFDEIVKPALLSLDQASFGVSALLLACLHPNATTSGSSRLLMIVHQLSTRGEFMDLNTVKNCIIPALALLSHPDRAIRGNVMNILEQFQLTLKDRTLLDICTKATDKSTPLRSSLAMDGVSSIPTLLSKIMTSSNSLATQKFLLEGCITVVFTKERNMSAGGCQASAIILSSMEKAGENVFPLSKRWDLAGKEIFEAFIKYDETDIPPTLGQLRDCVLSMLKGVVVNEPQNGDDTMSIQISIGPSQTGRRMRSYSVGDPQHFATLDPYPETMLQAVVKSLSSNTSPFHLSKHVIQLVVMRQSWANGIFPKLSVKSKNTVISALLSLRTRHNDELAGSAILNLPLRAAEFIEMLQAIDASKSEIDQSAVVFITDCIRGKLDILGTAGDISMLSSKLFDQLLSLSSTKSTMAIDGDSGSRDYTRVSVLQTLYAIHSLYKSQLALTLDSGGGKTPSKRKRSRSHSDVGSRKLLASEADLLVGLVGGNTSAFFPLDSGRGRALTLSLLTCLCEESPSTVVTSLLPALLSLSEGDSSSGKKVDIKAFGDAFVAIIPAYCNHAPSANLSIFNLLQSLVGKIIYPSSEQVKSTYLLIDNLVFALKSLPDQGSSNDAIASLVACVMAMQSFHLQKPATMNDDAELELLNVEQDSQTRFDVRLMSNLKSGTKIAISLSLLHYADSLMAYICGSTAHTADETSENRMKVRISEVVVLAVNGANVDVGTQVAPYFQMSKAQQRSILYLTITLLQSIRDGLSSRTANQVVRRSKGDDAALCLRLWNELLQTHTHALRAPAKLGMTTMNATKKKFWSAASLATSDCLENLQNLLPIPHFLASISSALDSSSEVDTYIRKKSLGFLADRVTGLSHDSPEASLFLEMVPDLLALIDVDDTSTDDDSLAAIRRTIILQQGCLVAIECFVRSLYPITDNGKLAANAAAAFLPALASITSLLENTASSWKAAIDECSDGTSGVADAHSQLLSSCLLCVSTIITTLKARCLPHLPTIIKPLVASLILVNGLFDGVQESGTTVTELLQLSIVKTLTAIAITLPQFLPPFLPLLFSNGALLSNSLAHGTSIRDAALEVKTALASKVQIRQLTPALGQALSNTLNSDGGDWQEACNNLSLLTMAVEHSQRTEISPVIGKIFNGLVMAYGYEGDDSGSRSQLLMHANKCLISLVMKLSEAQLSPLYARLREWKGDIMDDESSVGESLTIRRHAFWSLSAELSKSLRSIFLPCLTSVLPDVIDELENAVSLLCQGSAKKVDGAKRRRIDVLDDSIDDVVNKVKPLQPLLLCLESALKSDAHEGGDWTRGDDNQRYNMILGQLGKLLLSQVPKEMSLLTDLTLAEKTSTTAYQQLVQGVGTMEYGNIVGCLTALATAAGNEQLWKPLNFAVLDACGHKRSEVRKAGITCLLSIIETIGEEYMVLLPECLPVLSEMLEDEDEIAGMAKECVRQGEELLGESLEDSLR